MSFNLTAMITLNAFVILGCGAAALLGLIFSSILRDIIVQRRNRWKD